MKKFSLLLIILIYCNQLKAQEINLGIILDVPELDERTEMSIKSLKDEIQKTVGTSYRISLEKEDILLSKWDSEIAVQHYNTLSKRCDFIITMGPKVAMAINKNGVIIKPTISLGIINPGLQGIKITDKGTSGKENYSFILTSFDMKDELKNFRELVQFKNISILFDQRGLEAVNRTIRQEYINNLENEFNAKFNFVPVNENNLQQALNSMPEETDGVYLTFMLELGDEDILTISNYLKERKLPSFSMMRGYVDLGIMACTADDNSFEQVIRKAAIMIDGVLNDEQLSEMPVSLNQKEELYLNMNTARAIGYSPNLNTLYTANILQDIDAHKVKIYDIQEIIELGINENLNIKISEKDILLSDQDIKSAISNYYPSIELSSNGRLIDENRANPLSQTSEQTISGSVSASQIILSQEIIMNIKIQKLLKKTQEFATKQEILDIIQECYKAYFYILQAKTNVEIQKENMAKSKKNLELAKSRVTVGLTSSSDIYRWESELANAKQNVVEAQSNLFLTKLRLNNLLNNKLEQGYDIKDITIDDDIYKSYSESELIKNISGPIQIITVSEFLAQVAISNYPLRNQLEVSKHIVDKQILMNKRKYYIPTISAQAQVDQTLFRGGIGSEPDPGMPDFYNTTWNAGIYLSYPIFDGNRRSINLQYGKIQLDQINTELENMNNNISLNMQSLTFNMLTTVSAIHFAEISSDNAEMNYKLVSENYKKGLTSITTMLDAQNSALQAKLGYYNSIYNFLVSYIDLENKIGFYSNLASPQELNDFNNRLYQYLNNKK